MTQSHMIRLDPSAIFLTSQESAIYGHLRHIFHDVTLFGGCLRDNYIRTHTPYSIPTKDIDVKVSRPAIICPQHVEKSLSSLPLNEWSHVPAHIQEELTDWLGLHVTRVKNRPDRWSLEIANHDKPDDKPVDISFMKPFSPQRSPEFIISPVQVPFSAVAFHDERFIAHINFRRDTESMTFRIPRHKDLRRILWEHDYFHRMKEKYPDLKLGNPEMPFLIAASKIYGLIRRNGKGTEAQQFNVPSPH